MTDLTLVGIGAGNPEHLTLQAIRALNEADLILIPRKAAASDLAEVRRAILHRVLTAPVRIAEFDMPVRDETIPDYAARVTDWHDRIAAIWHDAMQGQAKVAMMVWGDPSLYDSTLRIAERLPVTVRVIPGITSIQALCATHAIPLNDVAAPVTITTGRRLRQGWPADAQTVVVMLDGDCAFTTLPQQGVTIWWSAYAGMPQEIALSGPLAETGPHIVTARAKARAAHGWIMDIYLLRRDHTCDNPP